MLSMTMQARCIAVMCLSLVAGCFGPPNLPAELDVVLPNNGKQSAVSGSGAASLADSSWAAFRKEDTETSSGAVQPGPYGGLLNGGFLERPEPETVMYKVYFGAGGVAEDISDNAFYLPALFGTDFFIDGRFHAARVPGLSYAAISFGVTDEDRFGVALPVEVRFFGIPLGTAMVYAWGTISEDRLDGTFGYQADLYLLMDLLLGSGADQYPFYAEREP